MNPLSKNRFAPLFFTGFAVVFFASSVSLADPCIPETTVTREIAPHGSPLRKLISAAARGSISEMEAALAAGADINAHDGFYTALHSAAQYRHDKSIEFLLNQKAGVDVLDYYGTTALMAAAQSGCYKCVVLLVNAGAVINQRQVIGCDPIGDTALHYAIGSAKTYGAQPYRSDFIKVIRFLVENGADVNGQGLRNTSPVMNAARHSLDIMQYLVENGADVNAQDIDGVTVLMESMFGVQIENVRFLLQKGANPNARDKYGRTAMSAAQYMNAPEIVQLLKEYGAK